MSHKVFESEICRRKERGLLLALPPSAGGLDTPIMPGCEP
jgi:hypothetical protein